MDSNLNDSMYNIDVDVKYNIDLDWFHKSIDHQVLEADEILNQWLPTMMVNIRKNIMKIFQVKTYSKEYQEWLNQYLDRVEKTQHDLNSNSSDKSSNSLLTSRTILISGSLCFYGGLILSISENNKKSFTQDSQPLEDIYDFTCLYMLFDHFADDPNISDTDKKQIFQKISKMLEDPESITDSDIYTSKNTILPELWKHSQRLFITNREIRTWLWISYISEL